MKLAVLPVITAFALLAGCASTQKFAHEETRLRETGAVPSRMATRGDLIDVSDCRVVFDLSSIPEFVGIPLVKYNPFDDMPGNAKTALCPMRSVMRKVLDDGCSRIFRGGDTATETTIRLIPIRMGLSKEGHLARCSIACSAQMGDERIPVLESETVSTWQDENVVPNCAYTAAAEIGDKLMAEISQSNRLKNILAENQRKGSGIPPKASKWTFSDIRDGGFSGSVSVDCGTWDMARVQQWTRNQIEVTARAKLGAPSLEQYRVLMDWRDDHSKNVTIPFSVFPYQGFEMSYDSRSRRGLCVADTAFLGLDAQAAYKKAVAYIETILSDQGVVKTAGHGTAAAQYRFNGYRATKDGAKIEIPFELVQ